MVLVKFHLLLHIKTFFSKSYFLSSDFRANCMLGTLSTVSSDKSSQISSHTPFFTFHCQNTSKIFLSLDDREFFNVAIPEPLP